MPEKRLAFRRERHREQLRRDPGNRRAPDRRLERRRDAAVVFEDRPAERAGFARAAGGQEGAEHEQCGLDREAASAESSRESVASPRLALEQERGRKPLLLSAPQQRAGERLLRARMVELAHRRDHGQPDLGQEIGAAGRCDQCFGVAAARHVEEREGCRLAEGLPGTLGLRERRDERVDPRARERAGEPDRGRALRGIPEVARDERQDERAGLDGALKIVGVHLLGFREAAERAVDLADHRLLERIGERRRARRRRRRRHGRR